MPSPRPGSGGTAATARRGLRCRRGAILAEILVVLIPAALLAAGTVGFFSFQNKTQSQQDLSVQLEENLRAAMDIVSSQLRLAGCGAPSSSLDQWIGWVGGFSDAPVSIRPNPQGSHGDELSIAACTSLPVADVASYAAAGATSLYVSPRDTTSTPELFNQNGRSLLLIGDRQNAQVSQVIGNRLVIDSDPTRPWDQGLPRAYLPGTPVSRIDVATFRIHSDTAGDSVLTLDRHDNSAPVRIAEGITSLRAVPVEPPRRYRLVLSARSDRRDPLTGNYLTGSLVSDVFVRNG